MHLERTGWGLQDEPGWLQRVATTAATRKATAEPAAASLSATPTFTASSSVPAFASTKGSSRSTSMAAARVSSAAEAAYD